MQHVRCEWCIFGGVPWHCSVRKRAPLFFAGTCVYHPNSMQELLLGEYRAFVHPYSHVFRSHFKSSFTDRSQRGQIYESGNSRWLESLIIRELHVDLNLNGGVMNFSLSLLWRVPLPLYVHMARAWF